MLRVLARVTVIFLVRVIGGESIVTEVVWWEFDKNEHGRVVAAPPNSFRVTLERWKVGGVILFSLLSRAKCSVHVGLGELGATIRRTGKNGTVAVIRVYE